MMTIKRPTFVINEGIARANIRRMAEKANANGTIFRPHFKTHQSKDVGDWFRQEGVKQITVSSVSMAQYFASHGWDDITIAFPYNPLEIDEINELASKIKLNVQVESREALDHLLVTASSALGYFIKIDIGTRRTGLLHNQSDIIQDLINRQSDKVSFKGLLSHAGHSYNARSPRKILEMHEDSMKVIKLIQSKLDQEVFISYGDTPSCSTLEKFDGIDEIRAGNFVFYDIQQTNIGSCSMEDIAVAVFCPVVAVHHNRDEAVIYGGAIHLSKDHIKRGNDDVYFGEVVTLTPSGWEYQGDAILDRVSQEHGIIKGSERFFRNLRVGDVVGILPAHSCLTANLASAYYNLSGERYEKMENNFY